MATLKNLTLSLGLIYLFIYGETLASKRNTRNKRSLLDLARMTNKVQDVIPISDLIVYGNWCGPGGNALPVDPIDNCCRLHDNCYDDVIDGGFCNVKETAYTVAYQWAFINGNVACSSYNQACAYSSCVCDRNFAHCLRANIKSYNTNHGMSRMIGINI